MEILNSNGSIGNIYSSYLREYTLFELKKYFFIHKNPFLDEKLNCFRFFYMYPQLKVHGLQDIHLLLNHTQYVKVWKYMIAICSLILRREFLIRCAILVYEVNTFYSWTIRIMCYVKVSNNVIAICSLVLRRGFLI